MNHCFPKANARLDHLMDGGLHWNPLNGGAPSAPAHLAASSVGRPALTKKRAPGGILCSVHCSVDMHEEGVFPHFPILSFQISLLALSLSLSLALSLFPYLALLFFHMYTLVAKCTFKHDTSRDD